MSVDRTERLVTLICVLRAKRPYASRTQLIEAVPGYADCASEEALEQMFERDKRELREIGIPIVTETDENGTAVGYSIPRSHYDMAPIAFTPQELAAINVAAQAWDQARLGPAAVTALRKIEATSQASGELPDVPTLVRHRADEASIPDLLRAAREQVVIEFDYQGVGQQAPARRRVDPWGVVLRSGHWYVVGHDHDRDAVRAFRASRIIGPVKRRKDAVTHPAPEGTDLAALIVTGSHDDDVTVRVRVRAGMAAQLRRYAVGVGSGDGPHTDPDADTEIDVRADRRELLRMLAAAGDGAQVVDAGQDDVRAEVVARLTAVLGAHDVKDVPA